MCCFVIFISKVYLNISQSIFNFLLFFLEICTFWIHSMELMFLDQFLLNWVFFGTRVLIFLHNISAIWNNNLKYHTKLIFLDLANADIGHSGKFEFQINNQQFLIPACSKYRTEHAYTKNKCIPYLKLTLEYEFHTSVSFFGEVSKWSILNRLSERYWVHFWVHTLGWMGDDSH